MTNTPIYINRLGNVSPQPTTNNSLFLEEPVLSESRQLRCLDPGYREFIPAEMIRRMGRIIKMGVAAAKLCMRDNGPLDEETDPARVTIPDAIITGTGLGCVEDTEKFLASMITNREEFLTPTSFIQSTHNTVAGQIALLLSCHGYNFTFVHRGVSFESALIDAMMQISLGQISNVLVGGSDEITANSFAITSRLGFWKHNPVHTMELFHDPQRGTIAGEGAAFLFLENQKNDRSYARLTGVSIFMKPVYDIDVNKKLHAFLSSHGLTPGDISLVIMGFNGDPRTDRIYHHLAETEFPNTPTAGFKHLCGEYHTASAFATWLGAMVMKTRQVPGIIRVNTVLPPSQPEHILIYNHYRENNQAFILLSRS
ncbi:MAG: beta-ketoacyl synthase N-terminal-like domain-containing protein [Bacteroidales bacterium]